MRPFRSLLAVLLSLSLIWASGQQALARVGLDGGMEITLCSGSGPALTIRIDANGNRAAPHDCGDCLAAHATGPLPGPCPLTPPLGLGDAAHRAPAPLAASLPTTLLPVQPRAPPAAL